MTFTKTTLAALALAIPAFAAQTNASHAASIKPLQGIVFAAGDVKGVGYFQPRNGACRLVVTLAQDASNEVARHEIDVQSGHAYEVSANHSRFQFGCVEAANAMSFKALRPMAAAN